MKNVLLISLFLIPVMAFGQVEDLTKDLPFFTQQMDNYQRWLNQSGLGELLKVEDINVEKDRLSLYLSFPFEDIDSVMTAWGALKEGYEVNSLITLEQALFYKMIHFMEVRQAMADVQIFDTYDLKKEPLFMRAIYFEDDSVQVEENNPKSEIREVKIQAVSFENKKDASLEEIQKTYSKEWVFDIVYSYAEERFCESCYENTNCSDRIPEIRVLEQNDVLRFEVTDLCREVIVDARNTPICRILNLVGRDCNWVKREKLEFIFTYTPNNEGFLLGVEIDGKYGSGRYDKVPRGGYYSMDIDYDGYLKDYADVFSNQLKQILTSKRP